MLEDRVPPRRDVGALRGKVGRVHLGTERSVTMRCPAGEALNVRVVAALSLFQEDCVFRATR